MTRMSIACCLVALLASCQTPMPAPARQPTIERYVPPHRSAARPDQRFRQMEEDIRVMKDRNLAVQREISRDVR